MTTKAKGIIDYRVDLEFSRGVRDIIQIAFRIRLIEIDGGRHDLFFNRLDTDGHFDGAGSAEHVASRALGGADGHLSRVLAKDGFDGLRFANVALRGRSAMGVDVIDVGRIETGVAQGHFHATRRAFAEWGWRGDVVRVSSVAIAE